MRIAGLAVTETGSGAPVVLVHGWAGLKEGWARLPAALAAQGRRSVAIDLPGWGESPAPRHFPHTPEAYATALAAVLERTGPCPVIAHSMGAQSAMVLAARRPRLVARLVLLAPALAPWRPRKLLSRSMRDVVRFPLVGVPLARLALLYLRRDPARWRRMFLRCFAHPERLAGDPVLEESLERVCERLTRTPTRTFAASSPGVLDFDGGQLAPHVIAPTLAVTGAEDRVTRPAPVEAIARSLPKGRVLRLEEVAHFPHVEALDTVADAIGDHLGR